MIRGRWIGIAMFPYSSIHTCAYDHAIELLNFFGYGRLPCVPCPHDTCFHEADKSVPYRFVCLWTANSGDGVPLFVEELTKAVLEAGTQAPATLAAIPHPGLSVPPTLHASLMARLDRLGHAAKEVAQIGAVLGREFSHELIRHA